jgi:nucleotide-binding universal stress UspA family protein
MKNTSQNPIVVGVDGSPNAAFAAAWAVSIGGRMNAPVTAATTWTMPPADLGYGFDDPYEVTEEQAVKEAGLALHEEGLDGIEVVTTRGPAADALLETASHLNASMLVVGTRGLGPLSGLLLGSVSRRLLFRTDRPLVVVPYTSSQSPPGLTRLLVGVDCSPIARRVVSWAADFCESVDVSATVVRCADPGCERPPGLVDRVDQSAMAETEKALEPFRSAGVEYEIVVSHDDPRSTLLEVAAHSDTGLIVVGQRGAGQFGGLGGTTSYLVRHSPVPLAVIP